MTEVHPMLAIDVARDQATARAILADLRHTAEADPDPIRRELAREIVEGRLTARQVTSYMAYGETLGARLDEVVEHWNTVPENEREERATAGWAELGEPAGADASTVEQLLATVEAGVLEALVETGELSIGDAMELVAEVRHDAG